MINILVALIGFICGYGVRELISRQRRAQVRRRRRAEDLRQHSGDPEAISRKASSNPAYRPRPSEPAP